MHITKIDQFFESSRSDRLSAVLLRVAGKHVLANLSGRLARFSLVMAIVLLPFRFRFILLERPAGIVWNDYTDLLVFASELFMLFTLFFWISKLFLETRPLKFGPLFLSLPLAGLVGMGLVSSIFSIDPLLSIYHTIRLTLLAGLYLYLINEVPSPSLVAAATAIQILVQSIVGIAQTINQHSLSLISLQELELDPAWGGVSIVSADGIRSLRAYGLTDHPNILGGCLALGLLVFLTWYLERHSRWQVVAGSAFLLGCLALFLTFSRSAWIALIAGLAWTGWLLARNSHKRAFSAWLNLTVAACLLILPFMWANSAYLGARLNQDGSFASVEAEKRSIDERLEVMETANEVFSSRPLTGVGLGAFPIAQSRLYPLFPFNYQPPHMHLLNAAAETGLVGAFVFVLAAILPWVAMAWNRRRLEFRPGFIAISGALAAVTIVGFFDYYTWLLAPGRLWQWLIWGLWASTYQSSHTRH